MLEKLVSIVAEQLHVEESRVVPEADFKADLGADSLDLFELVSALEEEYDIEIPSEEMEPENFNSVKAIYEMIQRLKEEQD